MKTSHHAAAPRRPHQRFTASLAGTILSVGLVASLVGCSGAAKADSEPDLTLNTAGNVFGTKAPYYPFQDPADYEDVPDDYEPVLIEHIGRHGSRLLSSKKYDDLLLQLWEIAQADGALTELGEGFGPEVKQIIATHEEEGYGSLSGRGALEHEEIARRAYQRMEDLFDSAIDEEQAINIVTSGVDRAVESGESFVEGLVQRDEDLEEIILDPVEDPALLYFHDTDAEYIEYTENDPRLEAAIDEVEGSEDIDTIAHTILARLFTPEFIERIDAGEFDLVDHGKGEKHLESVADAAAYLYELYVIAPGMSEEVDLDLTKYISDEDATELAYLSDAKDFYEKGPGFEGDDVTYRMANVLLDAFLTAVEGVSTGDTEEAADFRFAHAEEIIPFAALLQLPGSTQPAAEDELYTYDDNPWRGGQVAPMAANIQWDVFVNEDDDDDVIVRMLYNEQETAFAFDCEPIEDGSFFYDAAELTRCLAEPRGA